MEKLSNINDNGKTKARVIAGKLVDARFDARERSHVIIELDINRVDFLRLSKTIGKSICISTEIDEPDLGRFS